jgi:hypothetical protein
MRMEKLKKKAIMPPIKNKVPGKRTMRREI